MCVCVSAKQMRERGSERGRGAGWRGKEMGEGKEGRTKLLGQ